MPKKYTEPKEQAVEFNADQLMSERFSIRVDKEHPETDHIQSVYGATDILRL